MAGAVSAGAVSAGAVGAGVSFAGPDRIGESLAGSSTSGVGGIGVVAASGGGVTLSGFWFWKNRKNSVSGDSTMVVPFGPSAARYDCIER